MWLWGELYNLVLIFGSLASLQIIDDAKNCLQLISLEPISNYFLS